MLRPKARPLSHRTADRIGRREPRPEDGQPSGENFTSQAVTPMTASTSRYFFSWRPRAGDGSDAKAEMMMGVAQAAFAEDKAMIGKQQRIIDFDPTRRELLTNADIGPTQMRRVIEELIEAERHPSPERASGAQ